MMTTEVQYGTCVGCEKPFRLTGDGAIRLHPSVGTIRTTCAGSGEAPKALVEKKQRVPRPIALRRSPAPSLPKPTSEPVVVPEPVPAPMRKCACGAPRSRHYREIIRRVETWTVCKDRCGCVRFKEKD